MAYYYSGKDCISSDTVLVSSTTPISLPQVVTDDKGRCATLTGETTPFSHPLVLGSYNNCLDCIQSKNVCYIEITRCETGERFLVDWNGFSSLPFLPQIYEVYSLIIYNPRLILNGGYIQDCFTISDYFFQPCRIQINTFQLIYISPSSFGNTKDSCKLCQESQPTIFEITQCLTGTKYYVALPSGTGGDFYGVTFTIDTLGIDLYCGILKNVGPRPVTANVTVVSVIGFTGVSPGAQQIFCEECLASGSTKVTISNCLDGSTEVIWGSNLFNPGDVSNISLGFGQCYEVLSTTTDPVTINELLNYEPSPTCTDCLNCEQVQFTWVGQDDGCGDLSPICPFINSYQYVPFGTVIGYGTQCIKIIDVQPTSGGTIYCNLGDAIMIIGELVSFPVYVDCLDCQSNHRDVWVGIDCITNQQNYIVFTGNTTFIPGQIVQVQRNGSDYTCYTLQFNTFGEQPLGTNANYYYSLTEVPFNTCEQCQSGSTIGITIIDCDYASASYVTVSLYDYLRLTGGDGNPATPVLQYDGKCHLLLNDCPIDNTYPLVTSTLYNNCIECSEDLNVTRYSGTTCFSQETIIIVYNETNILTPGDIVITNRGTCVTISGMTDLRTSEGTITLTGLTSCYECYLNDDPNYQVFFQQCLSGEIYFIPLSSIGFLPTLGEVYFLDFTYGKEPILHQTCFTVIGLQPQQPDANMSFNSISLPYVDCSECFTNNLIRFLVEDCISGDMHVVGYPSSSGVEGLVTYTPIGEVDQYCGTILGITESDPIDSSLITILGNVVCEDCLSAVAKKRILTNCLNGNQEVVWGSLLFAEGNITHIQTGEGCYEVGPETELEVTLNEFLDFDNYPSCQECIQCNGVHYFYSACTPNYNITSISSTSPGYYTYLQVFDQSNNILWFTDSSNTLVKFNVLSQTVINSYSLSVQIQGFLFLHPTNNKIYFKNGASLRSFDTVTTAVNLVYLSPYGGDFGDYYYDPTTDKIWLPNFYTTVIIVFNLTTTVSQVINLPYQYPRPITYNPNNNKIYVVDYFNPYFYVIDRTTLNVDSVNYTSHYQSDVIFYENSTNRVFGRYFYIDCSTNNSYYNGIYTLYDIIQDPTTGYLISPSGGNFLYIIDPVNLTFYNSSSINSAGYYISYNSSTNQFYLTTNYYNSILTVSFGDVYRLGEIDSYQYASLNSYFFHPKNGCSVIYDILPSSGITSHNFYSFENFDTCEDCTNVGFDVWESYNCVTDKFSYVVTNSGVYNSGDLVNVKCGETDFVCFTLNYKLTQSQYQDINLNKDFYFADSVIKPNCENCSDGTNVAISIIDCGNQNSMFVNVSLSLWFILTGYNDTIPRPVFLFGDTCYRVLNECPFSPDHYPINPTYIYYNCESCGKPLEANSETVLCLQNCSGGTYTVSVNHPYWTNQYGQAVIQNNAVGLGGQTGYNG
jgi:hypothetical protein